MICYSLQPFLSESLFISDKLCIYELSFLYGRNAPSPVLFLGTALSYAQICLTPYVSIRNAEKLFQLVNKLVSQKKKSMS